MVLRAELANRKSLPYHQSSMKLTRAQYRMLHLIAAGGLEYHSWPHPRFAIVLNGLDQAFQFTEETTRKLIELNLVSMRAMKTSNIGTAARYELTEAGVEVEQELCLKWTRTSRGYLHTTHNHEHGPRRYWDKDATEILGGKLICMDCGRRVPCVSVKTAIHSAHVYDDRYGPVCEEHSDWIWRRRRA